MHGTPESAGSSITPTPTTRPTPSGKRQGCPIEAALVVIGSRTSFLVLREAFYGVRRFDVFAARLGVTDAVLSTHLSALTANGLLEKIPYRENGQRTRYEYQLTASGREFLPVLLALRQWTERSLWHHESSVEVLEKGTTKPIEVRICAGEGLSLPAERIVIRPRL